VKLAAHKGKKVYGYLNPPARNVVNAIVDELARDGRIARLYSLWYDQREAVLATYRSDMPERAPLSQNAEFKAIKNAIIAEAAKLAPGQTQMVRQEDSQSEQRQQAPQGSIHHDIVGTAALGSLRLLGQMSKIIENKIEKEAGPKQVHTESKLLAEIREKKQEQGLRNG
jgi:hypothetical protein